MSNFFCSGYYKKILLNYAADSRNLLDMKSQLMCVLLMSSFVCSAQDKTFKSQDLVDKGYNLFWGVEGVEQNREEALKLFRQASLNENPYACYWVARMVANEQGGATFDESLVTSNLQKAFDTLLPLAESGDAMAQLYMGYCYQLRANSYSDKQEAAKWYRKSAEQNNINAAYCLAICYDNGYGVSKDPKEYLRWTTVAAEGGNEACQFNLGVAYLNGEFGDQDLDKAIHWWKKASDNGHSGAMYYLGKFFTLALESRKI